jgi:two-component system phosphate regulon sensor histidine kinase PhoR
MKELLLFLSGFILCFFGYKFFQRNQNKPNSSKNLSEIQNIIFSEQKVLDQIPDEIIIINKEKNIIFINKKSEERFGKNIKDHHIAEVLRNADFLNAIDQVISNKNPITIKIENKKPIFQVYEAVIFASPPFFLGTQQSFFICMRDLTDMYKVQQLKSDFVANVSHELRTPIQTIKLGLETINQGHGQNDEEAKKNFLSLMLKETIRMEDLIKDLLTLSKIEQQEHVKPSNKINIQEIIEYVQKFYQESFSKKNISIDNNLDLQHLDVIGDKDKLIEIFSNLINNSIKYSEPNKKIYISSQKKSNEQLEIHIKDEGIGIPRELLPRISERFFRVENEKTRKINGTGLGLAIVKHLIKQHRGEFHIQSTEGSGTEISVRLPLYH